jgi:hypothetical protein
MPEAMEFGLLGPLMVRSGKTAVPVRRGHQRALLAILLLEASRLVPVEAITEALWGPAPPRAAAPAAAGSRRRKSTSTPACGWVAMRPAYSIARPEIMAKPRSQRFGEPLTPARFRPPYVRNHCYTGAHSGTS